MPKAHPVGTLWAMSINRRILQRVVVPRKERAAIIPVIKVTLPQAAVEPVALVVHLSVGTRV